MRNTMIFALAAIFAAAIAFMVSGKFAPQQETVSSDSVKILVAKSDISAGTFVNPDLHLAWADIKKEQIQSGYILEGSANMVRFAGAVARSKIIAGEPITSDQLVKTEDGGFMAAVLSPGMRAVTVAVTPVTGNAGFIFPGDKVDIILTKRNLTANGRDFSERIIKSVRVLAIDQNYSAQTPQISLAKTVTLEVRPEDVEVISLGADQGKLSLALVSSIKEPVEAAQQEAPTPDNIEETLAREVSGTGQKPSGTSTARPFTVQIVRGNEVINREFSLQQE